MTKKHKSMSQLQPLIPTLWQITVFLLVILLAVEKDTGVAAVLTIISLLCVHQMKTGMTQGEIYIRIRWYM